MKEKVVIYYDNKSIMSKVGKLENSSICILSRNVEGKAREFAKKMEMIIFRE